MEPNDHKYLYPKRLALQTQALVTGTETSLVPVSDPGPGRKGSCPQTARRSDPYDPDHRGRSRGIFPCRKAAAA